MSKPQLFIFSGLPGTGKTTLAKRLASHVGATFLRIDTVEQALRDLCQIDVQGQGYRLSYRIAADNLRLGINVVADSCNPIELTRREWEEVANSSNVKHFNIELVCNDVQEHRRRIENRRSDIEGATLPTWQDVTERQYIPWNEGQAITIDTSNQSVEESFIELKTELGIR